MSSILIPHTQMHVCFVQVLLQLGFTAERAEQCAAVFVQNSVDGVYSHGVNRFPRFVRYVNEGIVKVNAVPELRAAFGAMEQWDGQLGPGPLNAMHATESAMRLASLHGIGCVAMANTNHWMRAGHYGWQTAKKGFVFIGWSNTIANMPAWGAVDARLGNNPLVMALPYRDEAIVLDMAMSQFSMGAMEMARIKGEKMPVNAGFDQSGKLTDDPEAVMASRRLIPVGYWKGSGLALLLDLLAAILSGGQATHQIGRNGIEFGVSQVFIAIDLSKLPDHSLVAQTVEAIINDYHASIAATDLQQITYPGERVMRSRVRNNRDGIPVQQQVWDTILQLQADSGNTAHIPLL